MPDLARQGLERTSSSTSFSTRTRKDGTRIRESQFRCSLNPKLAPPDENLVRVSRKQALQELLMYVAPLSLIVFCVVGVIFLGVATPTEAAALGALSSLVLAAAYRGLTWKGFVSAIEGTAQISGMVQRHDRPNGYHRSGADDARHDGQSPAGRDRDLDDSAC